MKNSDLSPAQILAQIAQIHSMEQGKLSSYKRAGRSKDADTYYRLQTWKDGKNHTRHVRPEELPALQAALDGYARFCELSAQYAELIMARTRTQMDSDIKKKDPTLQSAFQEEIERLLKPLFRAEGANPLEWEQQFRDALLLAGRQLFGPLLQKRIDQIDGEFQPKADLRRIGRRPLQLSTLFGEVSVTREYYLGRHGGHCPADAGLGLEGSAHIFPSKRANSF